MSSFYYRVRDRGRVPVFDICLCSVPRTVYQRADLFSSACGSASAGTCGLLSRVYSVLFCSVLCYASMCPLAATVIIVVVVAVVVVEMECHLSVFLSLSPACRHTSPHVPSHVPSSRPFWLLQASSPLLAQACFVCSGFGWLCMNNRSIY